MQHIALMNLLNTMYMEYYVLIGLLNTMYQWACLVQCTNGLAWFNVLMDKNAHMNFHNTMFNGILLLMSSLNTMYQWSCLIQCTSGPTVLRVNELAYTTNVYYGLYIIYLYLTYFNEQWTHFILCVNEFIFI